MDTYSGAVAFRGHLPAKDHGTSAGRAPLVLATDGTKLERKIGGHLFFFVGMTQVITDPLALCYLSRLSLIIKDMEAVVSLRNMDGDRCRKRIYRNLARIMDVRILKIDLENGLFFFVYADATSFKSVLQELRRLGYPLKSSIVPKMEFTHLLPEKASFKEHAVP
ncbi:hypothetical protein [Maribacter sp. 2307ULW6-5]|uniref:hypothetical protein n=1 Tax=Maribacter sp. 2307ULW6-5 TaxID=3386275 RepID=UPI0039BD0B05